ncbi:hypothetical protein [Spirosoma rigui]|uniref:hypothetical protein n=1 Tax=Spirosoma rigui TaxID=564064 RepID=UPI0009AF60D1|nr:hypothetical protein [Spirosoma rigui]
MTRFTSILAFLYLSGVAAWSQCVTEKDVNGQVVTNCDVYRLGENYAPSYKRTIYQGTPYLTFPTWLKGTVQLDKGGKELPCLLAYDLVSNTVQCQFDNNPTVSSVTPVAFTVNGLTFTRQMSSVLGVDYQFYTTRLNTGQTTLLKRVSSRLVLGAVANGYDKSVPFQGAYQPKVTYYIRKGDAEPEPTDLSRKSLLAILHDQAEAIGPALSSRALTPERVIQVLSDYDALMAVANRQKPPLSADPVFNQLVHTFIKYPNQAWNSSVYSRIYVGFDINENGQLVNINTLSPPNVGFGFDDAVKQGLRKLSRVNPDYKGTYCLPVAFTYTNTVDKQGTYTPLNVLPAERMANRTLLAEVIIPVQIAKPVTTTREVWGYYP